MNDTGTVLRLSLNCCLQTTRGCGEIFYRVFFAVLEALSLQVIQINDVLLGMFAAKRLYIDFFQN